MKVAVINFSGNVGKSTVARHLLFPRIKGAEYVSVESINADEGDSETVRGKQFGQLQEQLMMIDAAVIDVGASNVEDFIKLMRQYRGSHEDMDYFVVPAVKEDKQIKDTIATIQALASMGVSPKKVRVVFNKLEADETVEDAFYPLFAFHEDSKAFTLKPKAVIQFSELYQRMRQNKKTIPELIADQTDYKAQLRAATKPEEKQAAASMISMKRLAESAQANLDEVFAAITSK
ncbi:Stability protein StdB [Candidatus Burkholderia verschuerenii]|uniref:Stability protein StdB n=1 Tax=Candidatus Burkholderia verschuerenii TaxID=242163 RepID=A0A0L0ME38_9BURK|nr:StbB family protein [Candidatus Burkholderia verschuerenii]KND60578.1 Stability protein StdB [Candidatus Burkholderia verschuerenii]